METPLPQSTDAEKGLLGSILLSPTKTLDGCISLKVSEEFFFSPHHRRIYATLLEMRKEGRPIDLISLTQYLEDKKHLDEVGGAATITDLFAFVPTASNYPYYCQILQEKAAHRSAILETREIEAKLLNEATSTQEIYDIIGNPYQEAKELCATEDAGDPDLLEMDAFLAEMESAARGELKKRLLPTFIPSLDIEAGGMSPGEIYVVTGLTSVGKSLLGQQFVQENVRHGKSGAIFTIEMPHRQYLERLTASLGRVSLKSMRDGEYTKRELDRFSTASINLTQWIHEKRLTIFDNKRCNMTPESIISQLRKAKKNRKLDIALIDYLGIIKFPKQKSEARRDQELQQFSADLKRLSIELDLVTVLIAQCGKEGMVFDAPQVESDADGVFNMIPTYGTINGVKKITGTRGVFIQKFRTSRRGYAIPLKMLGEFASLEEDHGEQPKEKEVF